MRTKRLKKRGGMFSFFSTRSNKSPVQKNQDVRRTKKQLFNIIKNLSEKYSENPELYFDIIAQKLENNSNISDVDNFLMMDRERVLTFIDKLDKIKKEYNLQLKECESIRNMRPGYLSDPFVAHTFDLIAEKIKSREKKSRENKGKLVKDTEKEKLTENEWKTQDKWFKFLDDKRIKCRQNATIYYDKTLKKHSFCANDEILPLFSISSDVSVFEELITIYEDFSLKPSEYVQFKEYIYSNNPSFLSDKLMLQFIENSDSKEELKELVDSEDSREDYIKEFNGLFDTFTSDSHNSSSKRVDTLPTGLEKLKIGGFKKRTFKNKYNI